MSNETKEQFDWDERFNASGGRFRGKVKVATGKETGRQFVALELATKLMEREVQGVVAQAKTNREPFANLPTNINDLRALGELVRRMLKVAEAIEEKLDAKAVEV